VSQETCLFVTRLILEQKKSSIRLFFFAFGYSFL
jgi:hypothetical protein